MVRYSGILALALSLGTAARSDAAFTVTTTASQVSYSGGSLTSSALTSGEVITVGNGTYTVGSAGGTEYTDSAGTTVYLLNDFRSSATEAIPNEQILVSNTTIGAVDTGTFTFSTNMSVINNSSLGTFSEGPATIAMDLTGGNANYFVSVSGLTPPSQVIGGDLFTISNAQALSGDINSLNNGGVSAILIDTTVAVPEPASVAMLGLGILGVGIMARRRKIAK